MSRPTSPWPLTAAILAASALVSNPAVAQDDPAELVIGFVPSREAGALVETIQPLAEHLTLALGVPVAGIVTSDYTGLVTAMETGQAHIGMLPPYGLIQAVDRAGAEVILQSKRFGSGTYHTQFFTTDAGGYCTTAPVENFRLVDDIEVVYLNCNGTDRAFDERPQGPIGLDGLANIKPGTPVSFVDPTSASGYIFPAIAFAIAGIDVETAIVPLFAGSHDASVIAVCRGQAAVGVSFDDARADTVSDCDVPGTVVVFAYGPEIPNDGVAVAGSLSDDLRGRIKQALVDYSVTQEGRTVLDTIYGIESFTEPKPAALETVRQAVEELGYEG